MFKFRFSFLLVLIFIITPLFKAGADIGLDGYLNIDRFETYIQKWAETVSKRSPEAKAAAKLISEISPEEIAKMKIPDATLADAFNYDDIIYKIIKEKNPAANLTQNDIKWDYNFFKRKLNEAYTLKDVKRKTTKTPEVSPKLAVPPPQKDFSGYMSANSDDVLLDVDSYVSSRNTRAVFWDASATNKKVEFHVGTARDFIDNLKARGGEIVGEVKTLASNYNPIYAIRLPGEKNIHYAITEISGGDRLEHLVSQAYLVQWDPKSGKKNISKNITVFGSPEKKLLDEEQRFTKLLQSVPKADQVVIGQKGGFEKAFRSAAKAKSITDLYKAYPDELKAMLSKDEIKLLDKYKAPMEAIKDAGDWEKLYAKVLPVLEAKKMPLAADFEVFTINYGSHEISDYLLKNADGKPVRWRIISNSWGDEVIPVANGLKNTGHTNVSYIGTAGAIPGAGLDIGDLVRPSEIINADGVAAKVNIGVKGADKTIGHVYSPYEETKDWLKAQKGKTHAVEVETAYLASIFNDKNDRLNVYLMISDVIGEEGKTLANSNSSSRKNSLLNSLASVINENGTTLPVDAAKVKDTLVKADPIQKIIEEQIPNRADVSKFQIARTAKAQGLTDANAIAQLIKNEASFTEERLEKELRALDDFVSKFAAKAAEMGAETELALSKDFVTGLYNPASSKLNIEFLAHSEKGSKELEKILAEMMKANPSLAKKLQVKIAQGSFSSNMVALKSIGDDVLLNTYKDTALKYGGLASSETGSGNLKFTRTYSEIAIPTSFDELSYFPPDKNTENLLKQLGEKDSTEVLKKRISEINTLMPADNASVVKYTLVDKLPDGALAHIVPELESDGKLSIHLKITPEGIKKPAVVMEEIIHLEQITNTMSIAEGRFYTFQHPFQWAETVANARSGSKPAILKLAGVEKEAAEAAQKAIISFTSNGIIPKAQMLEMDNYLKARLESSEARLIELTKAARPEIRAQNQAWAKAKTVFDQIEASDVKFNELVAKNDRKGVREMISKYLPWDIMEPSEKIAWTEWLEALEKPDKSKLTLTFRGLEDDYIFRTPKGEPFFMSTVMTKNQGSYTRRLRSLSTLRDKFGTSLIRKTDPFVPLASEGPTTLSMLFKNHSIEAKGSPFLSTSNENVARRFGTRRRAAFLIDDRRLVPNVVSGFSNEEEKLVPLVVFPDEVVHFEESANVIDKDKFIKAVEGKVGRALTVEELSGLPDDKRKIRIAEDYAKLQPLLNPEPADVPKPTGSGGNCLVDYLKLIAK